MKKYLPLIALSLLCFASCDDKGGKDEPTPKGEQVYFNAALPEGMEWTTSDEIGVISSCSRGEQAGVSMSANPVARLVASKAAQSASFKPASDADAVLSAEGDRSFKFYAAYPCPESADFTAFAVAADSLQNYSANGKASYPMFASAAVLNVMAPVAFKMTSPYALIALQLPKDIIEGENSTIKQLTISALHTNLSEYGIYNAVKDEYLMTDTTKHVTLDFAEGLALTEEYTPVYFVTAPFTVPAGGLTLNVKTLTKDVNLKIFTICGAKEFKAGSFTSWKLSSKGDSVDPVTFPVTFPLGLDAENEDAPFCNATTQPRWKTAETAEGVWVCPDQPGATATWNWGPRFEGETLKGYIEFVNSGKVSSPGIKGIWTGDYLEIALPVNGFSAGTTLNVSLPMYGRQHPMFWDIEYYDGGEWKCNRELLRSNLPVKDEADGFYGTFDGATTYAEVEATFMSELGTGTVENPFNEISKNITFANAIEDGYVKIRIKSVHAEFQNGGSGDVTTTDFCRKHPWENGGKYGAPFYFYSAVTPTAGLVISYAK